VWTGEQKTKSGTGQQQQLKTLQNSGKYPEEVAQLPSEPATYSQY
jgi:hypothetical protein